MTGLTRVAVAAAVVGVCSGASAALAAARLEEGARPRLEHAPGCRWLREPEPVQPGSLWSVGGAEGILGGAVESDQDGATRHIVLTFAARSGRPEPEDRPVVFDARGERFLPRMDGRSHNADHDGVQFALTRYTLDPRHLPAPRAAYLAVELVTPEARAVAAAAAHRKAQERGVELLPEPRIGAPFDFILTTLEGRKLDSHDLRGKVVLVDCWATWCTPCMAKMPELKALYERWHGAGFEVVGVCFNEPGEARAAVRRLGLPWPQVVVPGDEAVRQLWLDAGIATLPRLFLIDRAGVLRADCDPRELGAQVARALGAPGRSAP